MNFTQIAIFVTLAEELSFSKTAEAMNLSQSSVSKQLKALEDELRVTLIDRNSKHCLLTEAGEMILPEMRRLHESYRSILSASDEYRMNQKGCVSLAMIPFSSCYGLVGEVAAFEKCRSQYHVRMTEMNCEQILAAMIQKKITLAILRRENIDTNLVEYVPYCEDEWVCLMSVDHPLSRKPFIEINDLKNERMILYSGSQAEERRIINVCAGMSFVPDISMETANIETLCEAVSNNLGISLIYKGYLKRFDRTRLCSKLLIPQIKSEVIIAWPKDKLLSAGEKAFIQFLTNDEKYLS